MEFLREYDVIVGDLLTLRLIEHDQGDDKIIPFYYYDIIENRTDSVVGKISARIGHNYHFYYNGNVGYEIDVPFRGNNYSYVAAKMLLPLFVAHGMSEIMLCCRESNAVSEHIIKKLGAVFAEKTALPTDYVFFRESSQEQLIYRLYL